MSLGAAAIQVRAMREGDIDRVLAIAGLLATAPQWPRATYAAMIASDLSSRRIALVAEGDTGVVGLAVVGILAAQGELESIAVAAEVQRAGIGSALLQGVVERARLAGAEELMLEVRPSNWAAARFYARAGFVEVGRRHGYYVRPAEDAVLMRLAL